MMIIISSVTDSSAAAAVNMLASLSKRSRWRSIYVAFLLISLFSIAFALLSTLILPDRGLGMTAHSAQNSADQERQACVKPRPRLLRIHMGPPAPLRCSTVEGNWAYTTNGSFYISGEAVARHGVINCTGRPILRKGDRAVTEGKFPVPMKRGDVLTSDFFRVTCHAADGANWSLPLSGVAPNETVRRRGATPQPAGTLGLDIIIIGFDSVSRSMWMQFLPRSYSYLKNVLGAVVLEGYNIVGDGTLRAFMPMLTGYTQWELPEARRGFRLAQVLDSYPFIWKELEKLGYATQYGEDSAWMGPFTMSLLGFGEQPVDHYMRPFYLATEPEYKKKHKKLCLGSQSRYVNMLNWVRDFLDVYSTQHRFSFSFHNEYTHDNYNLLMIADDDLLRFLRDLNDRGRLDNAVLMLMSDHGPRYTRQLHLEQGKHEERSPFFSVRLPPRFIFHHPTAARNLALNSQRLTTPFDIHATLVDIISLQSDPAAREADLHPLDANESNSANRRSQADSAKFMPVSSSLLGVIRKGLSGFFGQSPPTVPHGISLLREIPKSRTCADARVDPHWCLCLDWKNVSAADPSVMAAAQRVVKEINDMTKGERALCEPLLLRRVVKAVRYYSNEQILRFVKMDNKVPILNDSMKATEALLQITLETSPSGALYEATVRHEFSKNRFTTELSSVSRINRYGDQPHCVAGRLPHLRAYCYCTVQLELVTH